MAKAEPGDHWTFAAAAWPENESMNLIKTVCQMKHTGGTGYDNSEKTGPENQWTFAGKAWPENEKTNLIKTVCQMKHPGETG